MTPLRPARRTASRNRRRARALETTLAAALSLALVGGAATAAHAAGSSPAAPEHGTAQPVPSAGAAPASGAGAQQTLPAPGVAAPVEHPRLTGSFTGVLDTKDGEPVTTGTWITWTAELTNTGDVALTTIDGIDFELAPGETTDHFSWRKQVTQADLDAGTISFSKTYEASTAAGARYTSPALTGTLTLPVEHPGIDGTFTGVLDTKDGEPVTTGTWITWNAELANTGDVALSTIDGFDVDLAPGETTDHFSWRKQVTQADLDAGTISFSKTYDATTISGIRYTSPVITGTVTLPTGTKAG